MAVSEEIQAWWIKALLGEQASAHPAFGRRIDVRVDGDVVTLTGVVETAEEAEEIEREVKSVARERTVVSRLSITGSHEPQHWQTVIAVFPDVDRARIACQLVTADGLYPEGAPDVLEPGEPAKAYLAELGGKAQVPDKRVQRYLDELNRGKALLVDRVRENVAFRVVSALEATAAETIQTLPPEPDAVDDR